MCPGLSQDMVLRSHAAVVPRLLVVFAIHHRIGKLGATNACCSLVGTVVELVCICELRRLTCHATYESA
jgi:hypothetical protein